MCRGSATRALDARAGIDFPDPEYAGGAGVVIETGPDLDLTDRNVREATARCAPFGGTS